MREHIKNWVSNCGVDINLGHAFLPGMLMYEYYNFRGVDGKYYSLAVVYTQMKLLGGLHQLDTLRLESSESNSDEITDPLEILPSLLRQYNDIDDFRANKPKKLSNEDWVNYIKHFMQKAIAKIYAAGDSSYRVVDVKMLTSELPIVIVHFTYNGRLCHPIQINIGDRSLVRVQDLPEFIDFIKSLTYHVGGVVFYAQ